MALRPIIVGFLNNAAHALNEAQAISNSGNSSSHLRIRMRADKMKNTLSIEQNGVGMNHTGLVEVVRNGLVKIMGRDSGIKSDSVGASDVTLIAASLLVPKIILRTKFDADDRQYKCESMGDGSSFDISPDNGQLQLTRGTHVTLCLHESQDQLEYLEVEKIKELVKTECGSIVHPIFLLATNENELNQGEIQEETVGWRLIHDAGHLVMNDNVEGRPINVAETLTEVAKVILRGKVDHVVIIADPQTFVGDISCRLNKRILEMNPNNDKVKKLMMMVEQGETIELPLNLLYDNALMMNNKPAEPVISFWERVKPMFGALNTCCVFVEGVLAINDAF